VWHGSLTSEDVPLDIGDAGTAARKLNKRFWRRPSIAKGLLGPYFCNDAERVGSAH
jgi:hypothetical protein